MSVTDSWDLVEYWRDVRRVKLAVMLLEFWAICVDVVVAFGFRGLLVFRLCPFIGKATVFLFIE